MDIRYLRDLAKSLVFRYRKGSSLVSFDIVLLPQGTCMFVWECLKTEGQHLGECNLFPTPPCSNNVMARDVYGRLHVRELLCARHRGQHDQSAAADHQQGQAQSLQHLIIIKIFRDSRIPPPLRRPLLLRSDGRQHLNRSQVFPTTKTTTSDRNGPQGL